MPKYRNPETGERRELGIGGLMVEARRLEREGWVLIRPSGFDPWPEPSRDDFTIIPGISSEIDEALHAAGYQRFEDLANASDEDLLDLPGIGDGRLARLRRVVGELL